MANPRHAKYALDEQRWARFRKEHPRVVPDLRETDLEEAPLVGDFSGVRFDAALLKKARLPPQLNGADFTRANLRLARLDGRADIRGEFERRDTVFRDAHMTDCCLRAADFTNADFSRADLRGAMFEDALLDGANFTGANLLDARFDGATLTGARFASANLERASFAKATCEWTTFDGVDLSSARGLDLMEHAAPSSITLATMYRSGGRIPRAFLAGSHPGISEQAMTGLCDALRTVPFEHHSCFISYAHEDKTFADRLAARMRARQIDHWLDRASLRAGEVFEDRIGQAIGRFDRFVVVISQAALSSAWVRKEVGLALQQKADEIVPLRLDDVILDRRAEPWATIKMLHMADFSEWAQARCFRREFDQLARALRRQ